MSDEPIQRVRALRPGEAMPVSCTRCLLMHAAGMLELRAELKDSTACNSAAKREADLVLKFAPHLETIKDMLYEGANDTKIARTIAINVCSVSAYLIKYGYRLPTRVRKPRQGPTKRRLEIEKLFRDNLPEIKKMLKQGLCGAAIAEHVGMSRATMNSYIATNGLRHKL